MKLVSIVIVTIAALIYGLINYYVGLKGFRSINRIIPFLNPKIYWLLFSFIALSFIFSRLIGRYLPYKYSHLLSILGSYWMACFVYFLIIILLLDLLRIIIKYLLPQFNTILFESTLTSVGGISLIVFVICLLIYGTINAHNPIIKTYNISLNKAPGNMKNLNIAFISDIHIGDIIDNSRIEPLINQINKIKPDIVLLGGDTIDDSPEVFINQKIGGMFKKIKSKLGVYAVLGNHEYYSGKTNIIEKALVRAGIRVLRDETVEVCNSFYIIGREDSESARFGIKRKGITELEKGINKDLPVILLDHQPPRRNKPLDESIDVQLSGHTHRGQFFPNNIFTQMIYAIDWGHLQNKDNHLFVSLGYGTWGPPIRIGNKPEIMQIKIRFTGKQKQSTIEN